jgi:hypothetical protein
MDEKAWSTVSRPACVVQSKRQQTNKDVDLKRGASFSRQAAITHATAARFMAIFGGVWAILTVIGLTTLSRVLLCICTLCITFLLLRATHRLSITLDHLPQQEPPVQKQRGLFYRYDFALLIQLTAIVLVDVVLSLRGLAAFLVPATALLIGLHMLHLVAVFRIRLYILTGLLLALIAALALVFLPSHAIFTDPYQWSTIIGLWTAALFWSTALLLLMQTRRSLA